MRLSPVTLLIFQGTPFCNLDCSYCYLPGRSNRARMSIETIANTCKLLAKNDLVAKNVDVLWHAGEPLVLPVDFYEQAFETIKAELPADSVKHDVQTNATLINERWIALFKNWSVGVGVSLDGPPHIHDRYRITRSKAPTSGQVLAGVAQLKQAGLKLRVICVLTRDSIDRPDELFHYFEEIGTDAIGFNIDEAEGPYLNSSHDPQAAKASFHRFLLRYFELVTEHNSRQSVRELTQGLRFVFDKDIGASNETVPIEVFTVGHNGDFGTFSPELFGLSHKKFDRLLFGNVADPHALQELQRDTRFLEVVASIRRGIEACQKSCRYFDVCKGGLPSNKLGEHGTFEATETLACQFKRQAVADAVVDLMLAKDRGAPGRSPIQP